MKTLPALSLAFACALVAAEPAPWYWWVSKLDGARVCSQSPLGPGWERIPRPYRDSRCEKLAIGK
jgi:hypothetical protein